MEKTLGTRYIIGHPDQLKALYFMKPCKANDSMMNTATLWGINLRHNGKTVLFHKRVYVQFNEERKTALVFRSRVGDVPLLIGTVPYEKARRYCDAHQQTEEEKAQQTE